MELIKGMTREDLKRVFSLKHGNLERYGPYIQLCLETGYFTPDDWYEALIDKLVSSDTTWLDIGCGRFLFPNNEPLAGDLSRRCQLLVGLDPDPTILENVFVHEKANCMINEYEAIHKFDLITLRMVAEHIEDPMETMAALRSLMTPNSKVIIYTPFLWSPIPILTRLIPFNLHNSIKKIFWKTEDKDTFPVAFKMNTRASLKILFQTIGMRELDFVYLNDCRALFRFSMGYKIELTVERILRSVGWHYPEVCILGVYGFN